MADTDQPEALVGGGSIMSKGDIRLRNQISNGMSEHKYKEHKYKDKHRDHENDKDCHRETDMNKYGHKSSHRYNDMNNNHYKSSYRETEDERKIRKEKERIEKEKNKDYHDKDMSDKDKYKERSDKHRDKDKGKSDKDKHCNKEHHEKEKKISKDKEHHKSSHREKETKEERRIRKEKERSKDKDRHNSSHREKETEEERKIRKEKERKDRHEKENKVVEMKKEIKMELKTEMKTEIKTEIKSEPVESADVPGMTVSIKEAVESKENKFVISEPLTVKKELQDENEFPLSASKHVKHESDDDLPLGSRKKVQAESKKRKKRGEDEDDDEGEDFESGHKKKKQKVKKEDYEDDFKLEKKKAKKEKKKAKKEKKAKSNKENKKLWAEGTTVKTEAGSLNKKQLKQKEEEANVWKWWEEEKTDDGIKWNALSHKGPVFADLYEPVPKGIKFLYKGEHMVLSEKAEEVAGFYAKMLDHDYTTKKVFNNNFFRDWRKQMTHEEREKITQLSNCDFRQLHAYYVDQNEKRKSRTKEEKKALKEKNEKLIEEYGWCHIDGHKQRIGNFKIEPPGLFRGRGEHPKQGMLKTRIEAEDVSINCSKDSDIPKAPPGHKWKNVRHDNSVTWLACWVENVQGQTKYVMLNAASKLKGEKDWQKYEIARRLHQIADKIRENYIADFKSKEMSIRQRSVAMYFIDKLALRAGNEKDEDQADTVGCCSLRVEHIELCEEKDGKEYVVVFDFLGKDSIRYYNAVPVEKRVFKNLKLFVQSKKGSDDLFDRINTASLNKHLNELMEGLTAKVFRTYNASRTLQEQLNKLTDPNDSIPAKILSYNRANREVAILCNHQRAAPKTFDQSMANLQTKIDDKRNQVEEAKKHLKGAKKAAKSGSSGAKVVFEKKKTALQRIQEQLTKLELSATDKEENKTIALGTSKLNYLDPRISVAWAKKHDVPIEKVYNKTQRSKFQWAIDMATSDYNFMGEPMAVPSKGANTSQIQDEYGGQDEYFEEFST